MAAAAASIHAPLTAAVLVFELSGDYVIVLPLLLATVVATTVSRGLGSESVYEAERPRSPLTNRDLQVAALMIYSVLQFHWRACTRFVP